ncbi:MAG TPA: hydrogenase 4 subunit B [Selenomonadales bacterium]|nr:hydrogenase 4 subunit B [Selenomonadales bacterium]
MIASQFYLSALGVLFLGVVSAFTLRPKERILNQVAHSLAALGNILAVLCAIFIFVQGEVSLPLFDWLVMGTVTARLDYLSAFFMLVMGVAGAAASIYAPGYCREYYGRRLWLMAASFNAFLLSMLLVFTVSHAAAFIVVWETMSLTSFLLVNHEWEKEANRRAAFVYLVMTHVGTVLIISAFLLLATGAGGFDFALLKQANLSGFERNAVFLCALLGFGTKAGMIPVHVWLPKAHPAAPSHVSALMSGVMIKTAIYGLCRVLLDFLGPGPLWWGELLMALAIVSCVLGVLYALMEHDLKRLLAYCSVDNIGIILLAMGAGLAFSAGGQPALAGLAWTAALFHTLNHALFKSLLFFGAGAVLQATGTKDFEVLGGLIKKMPYTAFWFLIGSAAISALPPFNGFVSEWLTFQALFYLPAGLGGIGGRVASAILIALLGLTGALAAACFVKAFGITFLAKPRSECAARAAEAPKAMLFPMGTLALLCIGLGIWPQPVLEMLKAVLAGYRGVSTAGLMTSHWFGLTVEAAPAAGVLGVPVLLALLAAGAAIALAAVHFNGRSPRRVAETWTCGIVPTPRMEYTATGFSKPIRTAFAAILRPQRHKVVEEGGNGYFGRRLAYHVSIHYVLNDKLYRPFNAGVIKAATYSKKLQSGSLQVYIGYILAVMIVALAWSVR